MIVWDLSLGRGGGGEGKAGGEGGLVVWLGCSKLNGGWVVGGIPREAQL